MKALFLILLLTQPGAVVQAAELVETAVLKQEIGFENDALEGAQIIVRSFEKPAINQWDVLFESSVAVSFLTVFGSSNRAKCEAVYASEDDWFAVCDVYDRPFDSPGGLVRNTRIEARYFVAARQGSCGPVNLTDSAPRDLALHAFLEVAEWDDEHTQALFWAYDIVGINGAPHLGRDLASLWEINRRPILKQSDFAIVEKAPDELLLLLSIERQHGLGDWLDGLANALP